jgi:ATP-dependent DNA helicase RecG
MTILAVERLLKVLDLETSRGYDNRAVIGGLERAAESWQDDATRNGVAVDVAAEVADALRSYSSLAPEARREAVAALRGRLGQIVPEPDTSLEDEAAVAGDSSEGEASADREISSARLEPGAAGHHRAERPPSVTGGPPPGLTAPLTTIPGIGPKSAKNLERLGLHTLGDLLWYLPRRYIDYSQLKTINRLWYGEEVTVLATVEEMKVRPARGGQMKLVEAVVGDGTGSLRVTWFNQPWIANQLPAGEAVALSGRVDQYLGRLTMNSPEWEPLDRQQLHTSRIVPVYALTAGVTARWLRRVMDSVVRRLAPRLPDPLPAEVRARQSLAPLPEAIEQIHFPESWDRLHRAQERLAFDEMLLLQLGVMRQRRDWSTLTTRPLTVEGEWLVRFRAGLPYPLTKAQDAAVADLRRDLASGRPMNRLLQGDVGSGKTVVAAAAVGITVAGGAQAAVLAPTSILAEQHFQTLRGLLEAACGIPPEAVRLLIGATAESEKAEIRRGLEDGTIQVVVGTHALLEGPVRFARLGLAVIDEQHRFGVEQRAALRAKGENPNLLVMTATPIPRSLALTVFGDLDLTILDEMPPGRQPIETRILFPGERSRAYSFVEAQIDAGHQAYFIYPLVEESDKVAAKAAVDEQERLQREVFPRYRVGLLHGRMPADEKDEVMAAFRRGEHHILVSTSVVEVGVDVPNATVMFIEGANRFGLAQLHQFRGRVGRGEHRSYCLLLPDAEDAAENERLRAMEETSDGFRLAELDLEQRGPGDFLGTRQAGLADLQMARLTDVRLIERARREADLLLETDPDLAQPEHQALHALLLAGSTSGKGEIS